MTFAIACAGFTGSILIIGWLAGAAPDRVPDPALLAEGERAYQKCYSCHAIEAGQNDLTGPTLHGIVGRRIAAEHGFEYSPAFRRFGRQHQAWNEALLDRFIADPEMLVPGTTMTFHGIAQEGERKKLIAYLKHGPAR